jgi:mono/diheme cytochrome c family protein
MMRTVILYALALTASLWVSAARAEQSPPLPPLPAGDGRQILVQTCTLCHGLGTVLQLRQSSDGWRSIVDYMVLHGAPLTPQESDKLIGYLAENFGPGINLPTATAHVSLPNGAGKDLVETNCVICHGLDRVAGTKRTPADWQSVLSRMQFLGAPVSDDDKKTIVSYLSSNFGAK